MPDPCDVVDGAAIPGSCGVFVAEGANGVGTQASPFGSIVAALAVATPAGQPVYVCSGQFSESLTVSEGATVYGGIDCSAGWHWVATPSAAQRTLVSPTSGVPLVVAHDPSASTVAHVFGFTFHAPAGAAAGESSIAAIVQAAPVKFEQCRFEAGAGKDGTDAVQNGAAAAAGGFGNNGEAVFQTTCSPDQTGTLDGGAAKSNPSCPASIGGAGGKGGDGSGSDGLFGADGAPLDAAQAPKGKGGKGQACIAMLCPVCEIGHDGIDGGDGGKGAAGIGTGALVGTTFVGVSGGPGGDGTIGGGGGGGGGARSTDGCRADSGGSGGAGGCAGVGGPGGTFGGSSIALAIVDTANFTFVGCTASSVQAGRGGNGAPGIVGAMGGAGGLGGDHNVTLAYTTDACSGGKGGKGGDGGHGGGGSGGHSVGLICVNTTCDSTGLTFDPVMQSFAGAAGVGDGTNDGSPGQAVETLTLP